jgi:hypothetical protein
VFLQKNAKEKCAYLSLYRGDWIRKDLTITLSHYVR